MPRRGNRYIRSYHGAVADINMRVINKSQIEIGIDSVTEMNMVPAPVCVKRRLYIALLADLGKHIP